ncbi:MAG: GGDEF domain-containing protein [Candidatus Microgenomates bacterium]|jgi:diguanylate cyclase (GGDEF)-like protein
MNESILSENDISGSRISESVEKRLSEARSDRGFLDAVKKHELLQEQDPKRAAELAALYFLLSSKDLLTNLKSGIIFEEDLVNEVNRYAAPSEKKRFTDRLTFQEPVTVVIIDLDNLHSVNNGEKTLGEEGLGENAAHANGDTYIIKAAEAIMQSIREDRDTAARLHGKGDELGIILRNTNTAKAEKIVQRILIQFELLRQDVNKASIVDILPDYTGLSFGITQIRDGDTVEAVMKRVDQELFLNKKNNRKRNERINNPDVR